MDVSIFTPKKHWHQPKFKCYQTSPTDNCYRCCCHFCQFFNNSQYTQRTQNFTLPYIFVVPSLSSPHRTSRLIFRPHPTPRSLLLPSHFSALSYLKLFFLFLYLMTFIRQITFFFFFLIYQLTILQSNLSHSLLQYFQAKISNSMVQKKT